MTIPRKLKIFLNYFIGPLLFVVTSVSIYRQITANEHLGESWHQLLNSFDGWGKWKFTLVIALMFANWGIESIKWQVLLRHIVKISFWRSFKSVVSGIAFTMVTPNRMGEFVGRMLYVPEGNRIRAAMLTVVSSFSQFIITILFGVVGLLLLKDDFLPYQAKYPIFCSASINTILGICMASVAIMVVFYFRFGWLLHIVERMRAFKKFKYFIAPLEEVQSPELLYILFLSALRFGVFVGQYALLLHLFGSQIPLWQSLCTIAVFYLAMAIVPTFAMAEIGIRASISFVLFVTVFKVDALCVLFSTTGILFINIILPAIAGSLFVLSVKVFKKE